MEFISIHFSYIKVKKTQFPLKFFSLLHKNTFSLANKIKEKRKIRKIFHSDGVGKDLIALYIFKGLGIVFKLRHREESLKKVSIKLTGEIKLLLHHMYRVS